MPPRDAASAHPIIYVRGYAGSDAAVEETVATPYMGFNLGSTKVRQRWTGDLQRWIFESPLIRLMKEHDYRDVYLDGDMVAADQSIAPRSVIIYRYYDEVSEEMGSGNRPDIPVYAGGLAALIHRVRDQVCGDDAAARAAFRVHLVAHSMGGLICRCLLQNPPADAPDVTGLVDKVFTYATPHNGIDVRVLGNVPGVFSRNNSKNFNRRYMRRYLGLPAGSDRADSLGGTFDPDRFFCLVGTNSRDYDVAGGWSRRAVGPLSDGLVRIDNATVQGAPRAFVHRSHSGHYGIVNSEEGYQNLVRFLFGDLRVDGRLRVDALTLPPEIQRAKDKGKTIRASYHVECLVRPRGSRYDLSRRVADEGSAVLMKYDELFKPEQVGRRAPRRPTLFSTYLSTANRTRTQGALVFSVEIRMHVPEYEIDGLLFDHHIDGSMLYRDAIHISALPPRGEGEDWTIRYGYDSRTPGRPGSSEAAVIQGDDGVRRFGIPVRSSTDPGIDGMLEIAARPWNRPGA